MLLIVTIVPLLHPSSSSFSCAHFYSVVIRLRLSFTSFSIIVSSSNKVVLFTVTRAKWRLRLSCYIKVELFLMFFFLFLLLLTLTCLPFITSHNPFFGFLTMGGGKEGSCEFYKKVAFTCPHGVSGNTVFRKQGHVSSKVNGGMRTCVSKQVKASG